MRTGDFVEATFENWEREFLQMGAYMLFTAFLIQRGSSESRDPDESKEAHEEPITVDSPWAAKQPGAIRIVYENSLATALLALFVTCFLAHAWGGAKVYSQEQLAHDGRPVSMLAFMHTAQYWFESFQNWQCEFLAVGSLVVLSIFLRQRGSPESKPVNAPHASIGAWGPVEKLISLSPHTCQPRPGAGQLVPLPFGCRIAPFSSTPGLSIVLPEFV
jgi:hypothetical protein